MSTPTSEPEPIARPRLRAPGPEDNKYTRGKVVVVGGAMPGAGMLAALAAQRAGAGYVELLGDYPEAPPYSLVRRAYTAVALADERVGAVVIGPGLGHDDAAGERLDAALGSGRALVLDADALALIGPDGLSRMPEQAVLTPHGGEFARLFGAIGDDRIGAVRRAASRAGATVVLKGSPGLVAHPDGRIAAMPESFPWLSSAGTGDVLSGVTGAMLARGLKPFDAARAALWLGGEAARRAGPGLIADDLPPALREALVACMT